MTMTLKAALVESGHNSESTKILPYTQGDEGQGSEGGEGSGFKETKTASRSAGRGSSSCRRLPVHIRHIPALMANDAVLKRMNTLFTRTYMRNHTHSTNMYCKAVAEVQR